MSERTGLWLAAAETAQAGTAGALATVARRRGSLPMASDAKLMVRADASRMGTIGGGCLEADVAAQALDVIASGHPSVVRHTLNAEVAGDLGLSCGGTVDLFVEPIIVGAEAATLYRAVANAIEARERGTVVTAIDWSAGPRKSLSTDRQHLTIGSVATVGPAEAVGPVGSLDESLGLFIEPIPRIPRLILFGAGHVGREIARAAAATDFHVVIVDDRDEFANRDRFPTAAEVIVENLASVLDRLVLDSDDFVISCTRGHAMDATVIQHTAASPARYVGMLGSRRKRGVIWQALEQAGVPRTALERVKVPIGEDIGADTPGEIGIAVMAELIRLRRLGR